MDTSNQQFKEESPFFYKIVNAPAPDEAVIKKSLEQYSVLNKDPVTEIYEPTPNYDYKPIWNDINSIFNKSKKFIIHILKALYYIPKYYSFTPEIEYIEDIKNYDFNTDIVGSSNGSDLLNNVNSLKNYMDYGLLVTSGSSNPNKDTLLLNIYKSLILLIYGDGTAGGIIINNTNYRIANVNPARLLSLYRQQHHIRHTTDNFINNFNNSNNSDAYRTFKQLIDDLESYFEELIPFKKKLDTEKLEININKLKNTIDNEYITVKNDLAKEKGVIKVAEENYQENTYYLKVYDDIKTYYKIYINEGNFTLVAAKATAADAAKATADAAKATADAAKATAAKTTADATKATADATKALAAVAEAKAATADATKALDALVTLAEAEVAVAKAATAVADTNKALAALVEVAKAKAEAEANGISGKLTEADEIYTNNKNKIKFSINEKNELEINLIKPVIYNNEISKTNSIQGGIKSGPDAVKKASPDYIKKIQDHPTIMINIEKDANDYSTVKDYLIHFHLDKNINDIFDGNARNIIYTLNEIITEKEYNELQKQSKLKTTLGDDVEDLKEYNDLKNQYNNIMNNKEKRIKEHEEAQLYKRGQTILNKKISFNKKWIRTIKDITIGVHIFLYLVILVLVVYKLQ